MCSACTQSCLTLCDPMHCQTPLSMEFSRQGYWSGLPFPSPGDLPNSGIEPTSPAIPALAGGIFTIVLSEKLFKIWAKHIPWIHLFNSINVAVRWVVVLSSHLKDEESEAQSSKVFFFSQVTKLGSSWVGIWTKLQALRHSVSQSVQSLSCVQFFATPWSAAHQASLSITNSRSLLKLMLSSWWCHPTISSSVVPFSSCLQSFPASGSFPVIQFFTSGGQSIGESASPSVLPMNIQDWFPLGWTGWNFLLSKGLSRVSSNTTVQKHQFFSAHLSL